MLWTTETIIFFQIIANVFTQRKQPYLWFIANNDRNILWGIFTTSSEADNGKFNVTVYKGNNSKNRGSNADNYFLNLS